MAVVRHLTTARLRVTNEMVGLIVLPPGFEEIWSRPVPGIGVQELLIEGSFDAAIPDGARVGATLMEPPAWQWEFDGNPIGVPLPIVLP